VSAARARRVVAIAATAPLRWATVARPPGRGPLPSSQRVDPKSTAKARVGRVLKGKWRLEELIGVGGTAAVYSAAHRNGNRVAVKMLHPELSLNAELHARFVKEGYVANAVDHPAVVRVLDDDVAEDGAVFLVMELLEGESLEVIWRRKGRRMPHAEVAAIGDAVLDVLAAAHGKGIVHRDVKPQNLFVTRAGAVKMLDFGIARLLEAPQAGAMVTVTGALLGTPGFMAPEQARGRSALVDSQSDLWSVGATLFALSTGRLVHEAETANERLLAAMTSPAPPIRSVRHDVPQRLAAAIDRALAFEKAGRWPDARSMQNALREAMVTELGVPAPIGVGPAPMPTLTELDPTTAKRITHAPSSMAPPTPTGDPTALAAAQAHPTSLGLGAAPSMVLPPTAQLAATPPPSSAPISMPTPSGAMLTPPGSLATPSLMTGPGDLRTSAGVSIATGGASVAPSRGGNAGPIIAFAALAAVVGVGLGVAAFSRARDAQAPAAVATTTATTTAAPSATPSATAADVAARTAEPAATAAPSETPSETPSADASASPSASASAKPAAPKPSGPRRDLFDRRD
jgi:serine/threonine-protein kinase